MKARTGAAKNKGRAKEKEPLLYYRTLEQMLAYRKVPVAQKFEWLAAQMEFYHYTHQRGAKRRKHVI